MNWFKKHVDTVVVLGGILGSFFWMNHKFNQLEKDILVVKTIMILKGDLPKELLTTSCQDGKSG